MPIILATWEAEIRITVPGQLGQIVQKTPSPKTKSKNELEMWSK
jgi:hypothetical protein